ncbi:hypothetical protein, partial [Thomasclavelia cocleata]|uniref:hypothetical protein n=1 Tax=Thomasclavelia cocleata TaxID=69824 RepID=UPI00256EA72D
ITYIKKFSKEKSGKTPSIDDLIAKGILSIQTDGFYKRKTFVCFSYRYDQSPVLYTILNVLLISRLFSYKK